jgi:tRNA A-37 threonylcarbamoyl transferase component Bud32
LSQHKDLDWPKKFNLAKDIAYGIRHLHKAGIAHGDLVSIFPMKVSFFIA